MASTDIDGSPIVILSEQEGRRVYQVLIWNVCRCGRGADIQILNKIAQTLNLPSFEPGDP